MTPHGVPETERELTVLTLDPRAGRAFVADVDGRLGIVEASEFLGVPVNQLARWAEDGTAVAHREDGSSDLAFTGRPGRPASLRFDRDWLEAMAERSNEVKL